MEEFLCAGVVSGEVLVEEPWLAAIEFVALFDVYGERRSRAVWLWVLQLVQ